MADQNTYLRYKQETQSLIYWLMHASNSIIQSLSNDTEPDNKPSTLSLNNTGKIKVSQFVPISTLIAANINPIPSTIYRLFHSVIEARKQHMSNASHKAFIDALTKAFNILGGEIWASASKSAGDQKEDDEDFDTVIFSNKFAALNINSTDAKGGEKAADEDVESDDEPEINVTRSKRKSNVKGKKGKRGKRYKKPKGAAKEPNLDEVPFESFRIIEDEAGIVTDYLMACYSLSKQWIELRHHVEGLWREVAYGGLNSAAAGTLSNVAIAMIKQSETAIFIEFPGHESYETVMNTLTRGNPDRIQGNFTMQKLRMGPDGVVEEEAELELDVREQFMIHIYQDLIDFVVDFQKTRSGKPTKPLLAEISNWDPKFNLQRATKTQRIRWRRAYTINWLYDLVNLFSAIFVQRNAKGQHWVYENVDWSTSGPWNKHRRLFGLCEFAGEVTTLAMQKPKTDVRNKISPHLVFQLACIVDSLAACSGWSCDAYQGHVLYPPAKGFRSGRDIDLFMDRDNKNKNDHFGICISIEFLKGLLERDAELHGDPTRHTDTSVVLSSLLFDFVNWLGESKYMHGLTGIPPSRFSNTNTNGLWEYSPFLCGVGLMESLELVYDISLVLWSNLPEPMLLMHLHNMLVQKGYLKPVGLYAALEIIFPATFFADGKLPTHDFAKVFRVSAQTTRSRHNSLAKQKPLLGLYRDAGWVPERIPDSVVPIPSALAFLRVATSKMVIDPETGKKRFDESDFINRARAAGYDDEKLLEAASLMYRSKTVIPDEFLSKFTNEGFTQASKKEPDQSPEHNRDNPITGIELLNLLRIDIVGDISGHSPFNALNYILVTSRFMLLFIQIEGNLKKLRNPLWVRAYEGKGVMERQKRVGLTALVLGEEDHECMKVIAKEFESPRAAFGDHIYWKEVSSLAPKSEKVYEDPISEEDSLSCTIM